LLCHSVQRLRIYLIADQQPRQLIGLVFQLRKLPLIDSLLVAPDGTHCIKVAVLFFIMKPLCLGLGSFSG
jgi:hypothetical protein